MKKKSVSALLILLCFSAFSLSYFHYTGQIKKQPKAASTYDSYWSKVDSLQKKGLNKSAIETVMKIYIKSRAEKNHPQLIKAILHRMKFESFTQEENIRKNIKDLQQDIAETPLPASAILHSMLAETYWNYYQQNRWKFMNRTETRDFKNDDINTWDLRKILSETVTEYRRSIEAKQQLIKTPAAGFDIVLVKGTPEDARSFRPTLYDFLAHRALDFFMNSESGLTQPVNAYRIDAAWYLNDVDMFLNFGLQKEDSLDMKYNAILILQSLLQLHLNDPHPGALIDANLKRLKFVHDELTIPVKDSLYIAALQHIADRYKEYPGSADALYEIAETYLYQSNEYLPGDDGPLRFMKRKAEAVCDTAIARFPYSVGGLNCKKMKAEINTRTVSFECENVNVPGLPFLGSIRYMNVQQLYARIVSLSPEKENADEDGQLYGERLVKKYLSLPVIKEWSISLPADSDKMQHSAEFKLPALNPGHYVVLVSSSPSFSYVKNIVTYAATWVSNISTINERRKDGSYDFYFLNRSTGAPLAGAKATPYTSRYDHTARKYVLVKGNTVTADQNGFVNISGDDENRNFDLEISTDHDRLFLKDNYYSYRNNSVENTRDVTFFFTDRSIYRPGQTVFFKGLLLKTEGDKSTIKASAKTTVTFYDVNSQKISEQNFTTNEFGTFNGTFTTPQGVLPGLMRIQNESGTQYISVEEYKRPKFEVNFEPLRSSFLLGNSITATLKVQSYSGAMVTAARVSYHVTRSLVIPWWGYAGKIFPRGQAHAEIVSGISETDSAGYAAITFHAIPDPAIQKATNPVFIFTVTADVTDLNGETHSSSKDISVSYAALQIESSFGSVVNKDEEDSLIISTRNMSGEFIPASGKVNLYKLDEPGRLLRDRLWQAPDRHTVKPEEFMSEFPNDIYADENEPEHLKRSNPLLSADFNTGIDSVIDLKILNNAQQGKYLLEILSHDVYGNEVRHLNYFTTYSVKEKSPAVNSFALFVPVKTKGEPGESAQLLIGSAASDVHVLYELKKSDSTLTSQWLHLNHEQKLMEIPIAESYRGNVTAHFSFVIRNRHYHFSQIINVPWSNKNISFSFESFREKILPGSKEEWRIKLSGKFSDQVAAEMLASMYDASLDAFVPHEWNLDLWKHNSGSQGFLSGTGFSSVTAEGFEKDWNQIFNGSSRTYDQLNWFGYYPGSRGYFSGGGPVRTMSMNKEEQDEAQAVPMKAAASEGSVSYSWGADADSTGNIHQERKDPTANPNSRMRSNFSETAFFYPTLLTNDKNEIVFSFTIPDALTRWKFMGLAHTKSLEYGLIEKEIITQKELMVVPNAPRFLRENDTLTFPCKITNLSDTGMSGEATLSFSDPLTGENLTSKILKSDSTVLFSADKGMNTNVGWHMVVPEGISTVTYKISAHSNKFTDGEEQAIPVLTNNMLVTESLPLWVNSKQTRTFTLEKLKNNSSPTLRNHKLTLEYTSNPAWYAVQALPYLMEYPYQCSEQIFSRYYANALASHIANSNPSIKNIFESWKTQSPETFLSNLEKNQELKSNILENTPWVLDAKDESERKKRVALLFDLNRMGSELQSALLKLRQKQNSDGSWSWFEGMPGDRYITQYILEGFGHLDHLGIRQVRDDEQSWNMIQRAIQFLDRTMDEEFRKTNPAKDTSYVLSYTHIHYLYARSFFKDVQLENSFRKAFDFYIKNEKNNWIKLQNEYLQAMAALTLHRSNEKSAAADVIRSLQENSQYNEELGRYWKNNSGGYYWWHASIKTQAILIEAFHEVSGDKKTVDEMQRWLLKNKQTSDWKTTKATAEACYALLLQGTDFLSSSQPVQITVGNEKINQETHPEIKAEAGTGYIKTSWSGKEISSSMADVTLTNPNPVPGWGGMYWQYFEQLDKITMQESPLKLKKQLFIEQNSPAGKVIVPVTDKKVNIGDRLKVRIEVRVDRDMEYVMMKDMRASGLEPENVLSGYKWQDGLGYYESTHDASTDFFFSYLPKGTYVFEYPLLASQEGNYSNGVTSIQCMYAPEFGAHSEGLRLVIGNR